MAFHGLTFPNQNVSSLDDRGFYRSFRGDGIIQGCAMSFTNDSITIQAGWLIACGGLVQIDGATIINYDEIPTSGYGRVMLQIDTSQASTVEDFAQLSYLIDYSASIDGFTAPVQEDINLGTGTIYQVVLTIVQISGGNIIDFVSKLQKSFLYVETIDGIQYVKLAPVDDSSSALYSVNNNNVQGGLFFPNDNAAYDLVVYGTGKGVFIRPNGLGNDAGRATFRSNGDLILSGDVRRTAKAYNARVNNKSLSASNQKVVEITDIEAGTYLVVANYNLSLSASTTTHIYTNIYKASTASNTIMYSGHALNRGTDWMNDVAFATFGSGETVASLFLEPSVACTALAASLYLIRIA